MLIVCNWKAYVETEAKAKKLYITAKKLALSKAHEIVLAPSSPHLGVLAGIGKSRVVLGAQDLSQSLGGAATGEITAATLKDAGASYVILGHSERRALGETDAVIVEKVRHALAHGLIPILCVGERARDDEAKYLGFLRAQIDAVFSVLSAKERLTMVVAYEPIWAIGKTAEEAITENDLTEMVLYLRKALSTYIPGNGSAKVRILYGGSVEAGNARSLSTATGIDGFLIGHASVDSATLTALVKAVS